MKTVKQFIEELQKLDQDKPIWVYYNAYTSFEPDIDIANGEDYTEDDSPKIEKDDYIIKAW